MADAGTAVFKAMADFSSVKNEARDAGSELGKMRGQAKGAGGAMGEGGTQARSFGDRMGDLSDKTRVAGRSMTRNVTLPIVAMGAVAVKTFADFDDAMTQSTAIMGNVSSEMRNEMELTAREIATTTTISASEAAEAYYFLASAGLDAEQSIAALPQVAAFAQAGMFDMATATDLATDAQSALGLVVSDASENLENLTRVTDVLVGANTLANASVEQFSQALTAKAGARMKSLNIDMEEGVAVLAAFADAGVKGQRAGNTFDAVLRDLTTAAVRNSDAFEEMNIRVFDNEGNLRNLADVTADFEDAMGSMSAQARVEAFNALGLTAMAQTGLNVLLGEGQQRVLDNVTAFERLGIEVRDTSAEIVPMTDIIGQLDDALLEMNEEQQMAAIQSLGLGETVEEVVHTMRNNEAAVRAASEEFAALGIDVTNAGEAMLPMEDIVASLVSEFDGMTESEQQAALEAIGLADNLEDTIAMMEGGSGAISAYEDGLREAGGTTQEVAENQLESFKAQMTLAKNRMIDVAITVGGTLAPSLVTLMGIIAKIVEVFAAMPEPVQKFIVILLALAAVIGPLLIMVSKVAKALQILSGIKAGAGLAKMGVLFNPWTLAIIAVIAAIYLLVKNWDTVKDWLAKTWRFIRSTAISVWNSISDFFKKWWPALVAVFLGPIGLIVALIIKNWDTVKEVSLKVFAAVRDFLLSVWEIVTEAIETAVEKIVSVVQTGWEAVQTAVETAMEIIGSIIETGWEVITTIIETAMTVLTTVIETGWLLISTVISTAMSVIQTVVETGWNVVKTIVETVMSGIQLVISTAIAVIEGLIGGWMTLMDGLGSAFSTLQSVASGAWELMKTTVGGAVDFLITKIDQLTQRAKDALGPLGSVVGFAGKGAGAIGGFLGFATGGQVPAASDTVPAMLTPGEFVVRRAAVRTLGVATLAHMNRTGRVPGFAGGGVVPSLGSLLGGPEAGMAGPQLAAMAGGGGVVNGDVNQTTNLHIEVNNPVGETTEESIHRSMQRLAIHGVLPPSLAGAN